ncbi:SURF1 family protein [Pseudoalteromonas tunicata]|nr:SURF1 family protein [Pseudoalteromonas tunicata]
MLGASGSPFIIITSALNRLKIININNKTIIALMTMSFPKVFMDIKLKKQTVYFSPFALLVAVVIVGTCLALAYWQLQRGTTKQYKLNYLNEKALQGVMSLKSVLELPSKVDKNGVLVSFAGQVDKQRYWLLDNRTLNGQVGYDLLVLVKVTDIDKYLLVNLGWTPASHLRSELPAIVLPEQILLSNAVIKAGDLAGFYLSSKAEKTDHWPKRIQFIDLQQLELSVSAELLPFMVYAQDAIAGATPHYQPVVMSPQKHYAYAVQWCLIGFAALVIFFYAAKKEVANEK